MEQYITKLLLQSVDELIFVIEKKNYSIPLAAIFKYPPQSARSPTSVLGSKNSTNKEDAESIRTSLEEPVIRLLVQNLTDSQRQDLKKINLLFREIFVGKFPNTRKLKALLTTRQCEAYSSSLTEIRFPTEAMYGDGMPYELHSYNDMLRQADFIFGKYEKMSGMKSTGRAVYKPTVLRRTEEKSQRLYEIAIERLEEIFEVATRGDRHSISCWMDREVEFGVNGNTSPDCVGAPRTRGSRSHHAQDAELPLLSKRLKQRECALRALRDAACDIAFLPLTQIPTESTAEQDFSLRNKLKQLK